MEYRETGIFCFECRKLSGIDCAGRRPNESTRCIVCFDKFMTQERLLKEDHMKIFESQSQNSQSSTEGSSGDAV